MPLIKCKECGMEISSEAKKCPKCGAPVKSGIDRFSILFLIFLSFIVILVMIGSLSGPDTRNYQGTSISQEWDAQSVCQTARYLIKKGGAYATERKIKETYDQLCTVSKVTAPLPGKFAGYDPYAVSWPNGIAARVFVTGEGLRMSGISNDGIPQAWYK